MKALDDTASFATDHVEIQAILNHRGEGAQREYLVQWRNRDTLTWEPVAHFDDLAPIDTYFCRLPPFPSLLPISTLERGHGGLDATNKDQFATQLK